MPTEQEPNSPLLTIIVPTRNESTNVEPLLNRLSTSLTAPTVVLFVDDSDDETPDVVEAARGREFGEIQVRLLHRSGGERTGGLGGAVLAGLAWSATPWVCVMDGDLQHPPEQVPALLEAAISRPADLVVGSRYVAGGRNEGLGVVRTAVSLGSTALAKAVFPRRLKGLRDPMSGFFLFRREALTEPMTPRGFKILLEIAVRHPDLVKCEVPFVFVERNAGTSKGTLLEGFRFLRLLWDMRLSIRPQDGVSATRATTASGASTGSATVRAVAQPASSASSDAGPDAAPAPDARPLDPELERAMELDPAASSLA